MHTYIDKKNYTKSSITVNILTVIMVFIFLQRKVYILPIYKGIKLRVAISLLVIITLFCNSLVNWYTSANALRSTLADNYLENNYTYANKLSLNTSDLLNHMQQAINSLGTTLGEKKINQDYLDERRASLDNYFNSLFILDATGIIQLISPSVVQFNNKVKAGDKIQSETIKKALSTKQPFISEPYIATSGQLIMLISAPIFDQVGKYQGLVAGTIYLESSQNAFSKLLSEDARADGSYIYVVDHSGHLIYHHDASRINEDVSGNEAVKQVMQRKSGTAQIINSEGIEFFAGYVYEKYTGWGIVSQTPISVIKEPINRLLEKNIVQSFPLLLLILFIAAIFTNTLTKPLNRLAKFSEDSLHHEAAITDIDNLKIKSHIYEVDQLYHHIYHHFALLNNRIQLDGLTGIANRRTFDLMIRDLMDHNIPFTMIMIDIDYFKKVNDTYGHLVGDDTLKFLSAMLDSLSSEDNLCFRYGGEEFCILVKDKSEQEAWNIAEQLRKQVANTQSPIGSPITISLGVASSLDKDERPEEIIKRADCSLFQSKNNGRNRTTVYNEVCDALLAIKSH